MRFAGERLTLYCGVDLPPELVSRTVSGILVADQADRNDPRSSWSRQIVHKLLLRLACVRIKEKHDGLPQAQEHLLLALGDKLA